MTRRLHAIARGAEGGMRDAESALDQLISFCGDKIVEERCALHVRSDGAGPNSSLSDGILKGEAETALRELERSGTAWQRSRPTLVGPAAVISATC